jgi:1-acyl-sn-glycerol-3-phosphate acyltransferase
MFYAFWRFVIVSLARVVFGVQVRGRERVPKRGNFILAPSHRSTLDIPLAAAVTTRRMRFMAKRELWNGSFWSWVFDELGAVPVDRDGGDRAALRVLEAALVEREPIVVFPEGTRSEGAELAPLFSGAAYLALRQGVPIVPVGIGGSKDIIVRHGRIPLFSRVCVVVGEPIVCERTDGPTRLTRRRRGPARTRRRGRARVVGRRRARAPRHDRARGSARAARAVAGSTRPRR